MLVHVNAIFVGFFGPLIFYLAKSRQSRFVRFHALQALFWHAAFTVVMFGGVIVLVAMVVSNLPPLPSDPPGETDPPPPFIVELFLRVSAASAVLILSWIANTGISVYVAVQASKGSWKGYPLIGSLVRRMGAFPPDR